MPLRRIKIKWKLSILYTIVFVLLLLVLSVSIYYISYDRVMRLQRNLALNKIRFLTDRNFDKGLSPQMRMRRMNELYVYNTKEDNLVQDPFGLGKVKLERGTDIRKYKDEYIVLIRKNNFIIGYPITNVMGFLEVLKKVLMTFFVVSIIIVFWISYALAQRALMPIKTIDEEIKKVNISNLSKRLPFYENGDEINELAVSLNKMLDRLERGFEKQKQFINDVSHELRTPVTKFIGYIQLLKRWGYKDEKILKESLSSLEKTSFEMKDLIESLLKLSREIVVEEIEQIDVNEFAKDAVRVWKKDYKDFSFNVANESKLSVYTSKKYLNMLLGVMIQNAVKYSKNTKKVDIIIKDDSLTVKDYGMGIENTEKIFDRFYREDSSRNKEIAGFGIGLSLAKKIAETLNIKISVVSKKGKGSEFKLTFEDKV